jgi:hypothetical protein
MKSITSADQLTIAIPQTITALADTAAKLMAFIDKTKPKAREEADLGQIYGALEMQRMALVALDLEKPDTDERKIGLVNNAIKSIEIAKSIYE